MLENIILVSKQVGVLFALMSVGFFCNRRRLLNDVAIKGVTELLVLIVTPCVIIHSFIQQTFSPSLLGDLGWALAAAIFSHVVGSMIALFCLHDRDARREGVLRFAAIFSNAGFMGLPLEYAILGADGVFFGAMYVVVFNIACWTWGVAVMCRGAKVTNLRSVLVNPGTVGVALGLPFFLFSLKLPEVVGRPLEMLADLNTPLAMIMVGWYLAESGKCKMENVKCKMNGKPFFILHSSFFIFKVGVLRLVVVPLAMIGALAGVRACVPSLNPVMAVAIVTAASAPVAALTTVIAARYDRDVTTATGLVSGTTLLSILTMPPIIGFALWLFGR
ncbi:MAG: AEC family transporter [Kiritimatiellae bacterium]|nr:AEC family transporter [Kiritimatiellia bacterium]